MIKLRSIAHLLGLARTYLVIGCVFTSRAEELPVITSIIPPTGSAAGLNQVRIEGQNLYPGEIYFGLEPVTQFRLSGDGQAIECLSPPYPFLGEVQVSVRNSIDISAEAAFTYVPLTITAITPSTIPAWGGGPIMIEGTGFSADYRMRATISAPHGRFLNVTPVPFSSTQLTAIPFVPGMSGTFDLTLTDPAGTATTLQNALTITPIEPSPFSPFNILTAGGSKVVGEIHEYTATDEISRVLFDGIDSPAFAVTPAGLECLAPPHAPGNADIEIIGVDNSVRVYPDAVNYFARTGDYPAAMITSGGEIQITNMGASIVYLGGVELSNYGGGADDFGNSWLTGFVAPHPPGMAELRGYGYPDIQFSLPLLFVDPSLQQREWFGKPLGLNESLEDSTADGAVEAATACPGSGDPIAAKYFWLISPAAGALSVNLCAETGTASAQLFGAREEYCGAAAACAGKDGAEAFSVAVEPGITYLLRVSTPESAPSAFTLQTQFTASGPALTPSNDELAGGQELFSGVEVDGSFECATRSGTGGETCNQNTLSDLWYKIYAGEAGTLRIDGCIPDGRAWAIPVLYNRSMQRLACLPPLACSSGIREVELEEAGLYYLRLSYEVTDVYPHFWPTTIALPFSITATFPQGNAPEGEGALVEGEGEAAAEEGEGPVEGAREGEGEGQHEGVLPEGEGQHEGVLPEGEGAPDGMIEGTAEGLPDSEGSAEGAPEGEPGVGEGNVEGDDTSEGEGDSPAGGHAADVNSNGAFELEEVLRVIQLKNARALHCDASTEDGYAPGAGGASCPPHSADYAPADWSLSLSEVLRTIQLHNAGGYVRCTGGEDGYCLQ